MLLTAVRSHHGDDLVSIDGERTVDRAFGWLLFLTLSDRATAARVVTNFPRQVIVNRYSSQIVASSIEHTPEQFMGIYEELLAQHEAHEDDRRMRTSTAAEWKQWWERRVARRAVQSGLYQIGGKDKGR